ncbi:MAG: ATP-binding protein [Rhodospirillales bacterium]
MNPRPAKNAICANNGAWRKRLRSRLNGLDAKATFLIFGEVRYLDNPAEACSRAPKCAHEYQSKISGPLFDRIDLHVDVPAVNPADLDLPPAAENSADIAGRVARARRVQKARYADVEAETPVRTNADADGKLLDRVAVPDEDGRKLLVDATGRLGLSARGFHRVLRVARTLADLEGAGPADTAVGRIHIAEALSYRRIVPGRSAILMGTGREGP